MVWRDTTLTLFHTILACRFFHVCRGAWGEAGRMPTQMLPRVHVHEHLWLPHIPQLRWKGKVAWKFSLKNRKNGRLKLTGLSLLIFTIVYLQFQFWGGERGMETCGIFHYSKASPNLGMCLLPSGHVGHPAPLKVIPAASCFFSVKALTYQTL